MFAARCVGVSLATFVLIYICTSIAIATGWRMLLRLFNPALARRSADVLFTIRILPLSAALILTLGITLPSFLLLEPHATDESVGTAPILLAAVFAGLAVWGIWRAVRAHLRTSRCVEQWLDGSTRIEDGEIPVFQSHQHSPTLTVAGVCAPKVIVSEDAASALTRTELRMALRHEVAHIRRCDNLKKLIFRLAAFPGTSALEGAWCEQTELAADDAAVSSMDDALDLASALIKVSRLNSGGAVPELSTGLLHSTTALGTRVQRLFAWSDHSGTKERRLQWVGGLPLAAILVCFLANYSAILSSMHQLTEWLVR